MRSVCDWILLAKGIWRSNKRPSPGPGDWKAQIHDRPDGSVPYEIFRQRLDEPTRVILDHAVEYILLAQGHNVCQSHWGKSLKKGLFEFRIKQSISTICKSANIQPPSGVQLDQKPILRVFFTVEGEKIVLLLAGYDKGRDPSTKRQEAEIALSRQYLKEHLEREKKRNKQRR